MTLTIEVPANLEAALHAQASGQAISATAFDGDADSRLGPLRNIETTDQRPAQSATQLIELLVVDAGREVTPDRGKAIRCAIERLARRLGAFA